jgi:hypothetical protein
MHQGVGKSSLVSRISMPNVWFSKLQPYNDPKTLPMFFVQTPGIRYSRNSFSCHENTSGKMVLGYIFDGIR